MESQPKSPAALMNIPQNVIAPFNGIERLTGSAGKVFMEVFVSKVLRKIISKTDPFSVVDLFMIHTFSLPFLGAVNPYRKGLVDPLDPQGSTISNALSGASEIPATLAGYWINKVLNKGMVLPWLNFTDLLWLSAGKAISQSVSGVLGPVFNNVAFLRKGQANHVALLALQQDASNAKMK